MDKIEFNLLLKVDAKCIIDLKNNGFAMRRCELKAGSDNEFVSQTLLYDEGKPTSMSIQLVTELLISALANNIQLAHREGLIDEAKHMKMVVDNLNNRFINLKRPNPKYVNNIGEELK